MSCVTVTVKKIESLEGEGLLLEKTSEAEIVELDSTAATISSEGTKAEVISSITSTASVKETDENVKGTMAYEKPYSADITAYPLTQIGATVVGGFVVDMTSSSAVSVKAFGIADFDATIGVICSVDKYLIVEPKLVWVTLDTTEEDVRSNTDWNVI